MPNFTQICQVVLEMSGADGLCDLSIMKERDHLVLILAHRWKQLWFHQMLNHTHKQEILNPSV
jgi:hypothetical protein